MKTIQINKDSAVAKYYAFLSAEKGPTWETMYLIGKCGDSCSLIRTLIGKTIVTAVGLSAVLLLSVFFGVGLWVNLFLIFTEPNQWLSLMFGYNNWESVAAGIVFMIFAAAILITLFFVVKNKGGKALRKWLDSRPRSNKNNEPEVQKEPSALKKLYLGFKEKHCSRIESYQHIPGDV